MREVTDGQRIYLDTNVVYSVLQLNGPIAFLSVKRLLDLSHKLVTRSASLPGPWPR